MSGPTLLAFDTAAAHCAAAVLSGDRIVADAVEQMQRGQAERLFPLLLEVLEAAGLGWRDLDAIGVGVGPGNFTGIRISVAAARGLALGLGIPAIGVSSFETLAHGTPGPVSVVLDGRQGKLFRQDFRDGVARTEPSLGDAADTDVPDGWIVIGDGADSLSGSGPRARPALPLAHAIARIAARRAAGPALPRPAPLYIRPPDAAPSRDLPPALAR